MNKITEKELKEILAQLEQAGWMPQLCDTPLPAYESVHAGNPIEPGEEASDMIMMPKTFLSMCPEGMVRVVGNSMLDAGISDGDWVKMTIAQQPRDGDIVVVAIGSECTVKSYYEDDEGVRWLIPQNKAEQGRHKVICLDETQEKVYLCGVVKEIMKPLPRVPTKALRSTLATLKPCTDEKKTITEQRVNEVIRIVAADIKVARLWYAVYRPMVDLKQVDKGDYEGFGRLVRRAVPDHAHLPTVQEMQRMAVLSFDKPVSLWDKMNAPVQGKRFQTYLNIAHQVKACLTVE